MPSGQGGGQGGGYGGFAMGGGGQQSNFDAMQAGQGWQAYGDPQQRQSAEARSRLLQYAQLGNYLNQGLASGSFGGFGNSGFQSFLPPPVHQAQPPAQAPTQAPQQTNPNLDEYVDTPWGPRPLYSQSGTINPITDRMRFGGR